MSDAIVLLSGGIDSATCLGLAARECESVQPIFYQYGQQTEQLEYRMAVGQVNNMRKHYDDTPIYGVKPINYAPVFEEFAAGVAGDRDEFTTDDGSLIEDDGRSTGYVPVRNLHLLSTGAAVADKMGADCLYIGVQGGDEEAYPDCRPQFINAAQDAINASLADGDELLLRTPLLDLSKKQVVQQGEDVHVDWEHTYSCYDDVEDVLRPEPCGKCPACVERIEAFEEAGLEDPFAVEQ